MRLTIVGEDVSDDGILPAVNPHVGARNPRLDGDTQSTLYNP
jgi:hypothetical protein